MFLENALGNDSRPVRKIVDLRRVLCCTPCLKSVHHTRLARVGTILPYNKLTDDPCKLLIPSSDNSAGAVRLLVCFVFFLFTISVNVNGRSTFVSSRKNGNCTATDEVFLECTTIEKPDSYCSYMSTVVVRKFQLA